MIKKHISPSFAVTTGLLLCAIVLGGMADRRTPEFLSLPLDRIGSQISGWTQISQKQLDPETLRTLNPTSYITRTYGKDASRIDLFIAYYAEQRPGESMHSPEHCLPGAGWEISRRGVAPVTVGGRQIEINKYLIQNFGTKMLMLYWYQSRDRIVASEYRAKLLLARDTILTGRTGASIVRILLADDQQAPEKGVAFASDLIPQVQRCFGYEGKSTLSR